MKISIRFKERIHITFLAYKECVIKLKHVTSPCILYGKVACSSSIALYIPDFDSALFKIAELFKLCRTVFQ